MSRIGKNTITMTEGVSVMKEDTVVSSKNDTGLFPILDIFFLYI